MRGYPTQTTLGLDPLTLSPKELISTRSGQKMGACTLIALVSVPCGFGTS